MCDLRVGTKNNNLGYILVTFFVLNYVIKTKAVFLWKTKTHKHNFIYFLLSHQIYVSEKMVYDNFSQNADMTLFASVNTAPESSPVRVRSNGPFKCGRYITIAKDSPTPDKFLEIYEVQINMLHQDKFNALP